MIPFAYHTPETLDEALALLHEHGDAAKVMAGGTALIIMLKQRLVAPEVLVSLQRLRGADTVAETSDMVRLGACMTHRAAETAPVLQARLPVLADTYRQVATVRIRNAATVGGALAHADPNQDPQVTLIALDAQVQLQSATGSRVVPLAEFFTDYYETVLQPDELLTEIRVPIPQPHTGSAYLKFLPRSADDYATVSAAASVRLDPATGTCQACRIVMGSVGLTALRAPQAEAIVIGQALSPELLREAGAVAQELTDPLSDTRGSADYKRAMAGVFVRRALAQAWQQAATM
jgi:carbon-monoxide dehydrogenase medium subunit